jgi:hypothetical protein
VAVGSAFACGDGEGVWFANLSPLMLRVTIHAIKTADMPTTTTIAKIQGSALLFG